MSFAFECVAFIHYHYLISIKMRLPNNSQHFKSREGSGEGLKKILRTKILLPLRCVGNFMVQQRLQQSFAICKSNLNAQCLHGSMSVGF